MGNILSHQITISFIERILLHGVSSALLLAFLTFSVPEQGILNLSDLQVLWDWWPNFDLEVTVWKHKCGLHLHAVTIVKCIDRWTSHVPLTSVMHFQVQCACVSTKVQHMVRWYVHMCHYNKATHSQYEGQSISFRIEFFALVRSVVTTPAARGIIPKVSLASVLKASFLCALCVTQL